MLVTVRITHTDGFNSLVCTKDVELSAVPDVGDLLNYIKIIRRRFFYHDNVEEMTAYPNDPNVELTLQVQKYNYADTEWYNRTASALLDNGWRIDGLTKAQGNDHR